MPKPAQPKSHEKKQVDNTPDISSSTKTTTPQSKKRLIIGIFIVVAVLVVLLGFIAIKLLATYTNLISGFKLSPIATPQASAEPNTPLSFTISPAGTLCVADFSIRIPNEYSVKMEGPAGVILETDTVMVAASKSDNPETDLTAHLDRTGTTYTQDDANRYRYSIPNSYPEDQVITQIVGSAIISVFYAESVTSDTATKTLSTIVNSVQEGCK